MCSGSSSIRFRERTVRWRVDFCGDFCVSSLPVVFNFLPVGVESALFFLAFFSIHFCGFHAGHSVFLNHFFPVEGLPGDGLGRAFMNPPLLWVLVFKHLMKPYGIFLIPALISERKHIFSSIIKASAYSHDTQDRESNSTDMGDFMGRPYLNVVRMHLLIFFFAFCHFMKINSFFVYSVVYFVYFFPWMEMKRLVSNATRIP